MICRNCQADAQDFPFCPYCGQPIEKDNQDTPPTKADKRARRRQFVRRWIVPLVLLSVVLAFGVLLMALVGFRDGTQERELAKRHQAEILYNRGEIYLEWGQYQLAEAHFEEALRLVPDYEQAVTKLEVAQVRQTVTPSPTSPPPTSTPPLPTSTPEVVVVPLTDVLYEEGKQHYADQEWALTISKLEQLRLEDINYQAESVSEMLFESHYAYGVYLDEQGQIEAAILQYNQALDLLPRHPEVSVLRRRADLYQSALNEWDVNWENVINFLIALYHVAPDYKDATDRLYEACIVYGQELVKQDRYCEASEIYEQAIEIDDGDEAVVKREADTSFLCQSAGPVPLATPTPDGPPSVWSQVHLGTLFATCYDTHNNQYAVCAQNAEDNELQTWIAEAEQPAVTLDGTQLAYRSSAADRPGLYAMDILSGTVITITEKANAHYPTWSPDGTHVAYTLYETDEEDWFIYIAEVGSTEPAQRIRNGSWPDWGPTNLLAFTSCGVENDCGIYVYNPDSQAISKLTHSKQDRAPAWSPNGEELAYMSDIGLSHNLYVVVIKDAWTRQITKNLFTDVLPIWSPDGQRIAFVTNHQDDWSVYSIHPWPGEGQPEQIASLGAESADWERLQLAWTAAVLRPPAADE
jgi:tetratricopeptide (TPR) repeat protein